LGAGGEPVDLWRTIVSHGLASLPPNAIDEEARMLTTTLAPNGRPAATAHISAGSPGHARIEARRRPGRRLLERITHVLRLDEDLSPFYEQIAGDPDLAWASAGAGRLIRSPTVFEDVVKTVCTTNCAWSGTERMVSALVDHLGVPGPAGNAFPTPEAMAEADDAFYRDVARAGYRGPYLRSLATSVAAGEVDLEVLGRAPRQDLPDEEVELRLLALPGVGPYAAAHVMMLAGRYSRLVLDSWTRPKYARLTGKRSVADRTIGRRFRPYGDYAGLAFWIYLTRDWVEKPPPTPA
jgi:N-glycosylase/DNA lyase